MFATDQCVIGRYARSCPEAMAKVATFTLLTVQAPLYRIPGDMDAVARDGPAASVIWGFKGDALRWWQANADAAYARLQGLWLDPRLTIDDFDHDALEYVAGLPGFGVVKGGFFLQLCYGRIGCLDTHNIVRFGLKRSRFTSWRFKGARTYATKARVVREYVSACQELGGAQVLWDGWCTYVADQQPGNYGSPAAASRLHVKAIIGEDNGGL